MVKALGALLFLTALAAELVFLLSGAGLPRPGPLGDALGPYAGAPAIAYAGAGALLLGTLLLARGDGLERPFAAHEALLILVVAGAAAFTVAALIGVGRGWRPETVAALALGGAGETLAAVALAVRIATLPERRKLLFIPGVAGAALVGVAQVLVVALGA